MSQNNHDDQKQCGNCKQFFTIKDGGWVNGWFHTPCPHCDTMLKTQTPWFELRVALHEHQLDAMEALLEKLTNEDKIIIGLPTGTGK